MERQADDFREEAASGSRQPATVNDFLPETDAPAVASDAVTVSISRETLRKLTLGADAFRELWNAAVESSDHALIDLMTPYLDQLTDAGLISAEDGRSTEAFDIACTLGGIALGITAGGGEYPTEVPPDDGNGIDALADNDDAFEDDVTTAEEAFSRSPDPDWPGEPVPSVLDTLPRAASFGGD